MRVISNFEPGGPFGRHAKKGIANRLVVILRDERVLFVLVGATNTLIGFGVFSAFYLMIGDLVGYMAVLLIAYGVSSVISFMSHRRIVFRVEGSFLIDGARFLLVNAGNLVVNALLLSIGVEILLLPVLVAQALAAVVSVALSFLGHKFFSFRR